MADSSLRIELNSLQRYRNNEVNYVQGADCRGAQAEVSNGRDCLRYLMRVNGCVVPALGKSHWELSKRNQSMADREV